MTIHDWHGKYSNSISVLYGVVKSSEQDFEGLSEGKTVDLAGFGKFEITERKAREGINPLTKEKIQIEASKSVKFKISKALKEAVNK